MQAATQWFTTYINGTKKTFLNFMTLSAARPLNDSDPHYPHITILTAHTFEELVMDADSDVLVLLHHTEYTKYANKYSFLLRAAAEILCTQSIPVRITFLCPRTNDLNDSCRDERFMDPLVIKMKFFPRTDKAHPISYTGEDAEMKNVLYMRHILSFIHTHMSSSPKLDLNASLSLPIAVTVDELQELRYAGRIMFVEASKMNADRTLSREMRDSICGAANALLDEIISPSSSVTVDSLKARLDALNAVMEDLI